MGDTFTHAGSGDMINTLGGTVNMTTGNSNQLIRPVFRGPVTFGTNEPTDSVKDCLKSLAFAEMRSRFHEIHSQAAATGTCKWLLQHETYKSWASSDRGLLWIKGKPGSGKSTLLHSVLRDTMAVPNAGKEALMITFFFHGRGTELQRTPLGLFRSLLHQLLEATPEALTDLVGIFKNNCANIGTPGEKWQWHQGELRNLFVSSLPKVLRTRPVCMFVDALDECGEDNAVSLAEEFQYLLQRLPSSGLEQCHICFTCRHYPIVDLDGVLEVCVEEENRKDISTFVQSKLSSFSGRTSATIPDSITERADGVFLWAWLVVKRVLDLERKGAGLKKINAAILAVPQELGALYYDLIKDMTADSLSLVQWISFATRPLTLEELRWAMLVEADCPYRSLHECQDVEDGPSDNAGMKRRVQTLSHGLAEVTSGSGVVQFIHQSVKDFFVEKGLSALGKSAAADLVVGMAHYRLSRTCIRYLTMEEVAQAGSISGFISPSEMPFLHYATTSWVVHTKESDARNVPQEDLMDHFEWPSNSVVERWVHLYRKLWLFFDDLSHHNRFYDSLVSDGPPQRTTLVHVMSRCGIVGALGAILKRADQIGINTEAKDSRGRTPLSWAAENGHETAVQLLLDHKAYIEGADKQGQTPLSWAAKNGHGAVVQLLLGRNSCIEAEDQLGQTPLSWAARNGHGAVVQLLLGRNPCIDAEDQLGRTPLSWAARNGHGAVVQLLLGRNPCIDAEDQLGRTPLSWAAENGHEAAVQLLLDHKAYIEGADKQGQTPLWFAIKNRHKGVARLLLDHGAKIGVLGGDGKTLLWQAVKNGHEGVVGLLLDRGADIEALDGYGKTPLSLAVEFGCEGVVRLLLDRGANIEGLDIYDKTPLSRAVENGHEGVVRLLLDRGAKIEVLEIYEKRPLARAVEKGYEGIVRLLLDHGANIEGLDKYGKTLLTLAIERGHEGIVQLLLDRGADVEVLDGYGKTPLSLAVEFGWERIVRLLKVYSQY